MDPDDYHHHLPALQTSTHTSTQFRESPQMELVIYTSATVVNILGPEPEPERECESQMGNRIQVVVVPNEFWICCCSYTPGRQLSVRISISSYLTLSTTSSQTLLLPPRDDLGFSFPYL
ncbi:hypothetical protein ONS95_015073 [Cadophora gregata]|uniref:uncharacterized protein n=1 Tax=Cadophora gregata TaxID=51156 RepID=UPI0026DDA36E|nr:uncharacterized protein ONS95_015073 [Cadophora gregata]KAK0112631.1 hypothetical protein ONS95_015073 [Cadophora gregata]